ncbi:unnamed protein product [Kuraishia capsulata CBS 1993]|uniref:Major facilitator superfamily (MFS) profile domain-containing protein n=1 Tax=Kuraishia capsulata CBS 1993 TaxID=1382522 RepID=W6MV69_9ASCO|nr:uncharacterized protein KUCA_T00005790001 [Kuraishia capsulata CBS 1993]CDK29797.1 unnamed protein product [Kuraishia capsulata CBS 1993]
MSSNEILRVPGEAIEKSEDSSRSEDTTGEIPSYLGVSGQKLHVAISMLAGVGFLLFGYDQGVMGSLLTLESFRDTFPSIDTIRKPSRSTMQGFVIAIYEIGCFSGALSTMAVGDKFGRRKMIFAGAVVMIVGGILQATAFSVGHLIAGRIVSGIGNGCITSTVPMWQSECAKPHRRGALVMMQGALITCGICISYWIDFGFYFAKGSVSWRFPIAFQIVFAIAILPFIMKLPESPRWLLKKGHHAEALKVFASLEGVTSDDRWVQTEFQEVKASLDEEANSGAEKMDIKRMFTQGEHRNFHRVMLALWSQIMQQITGINLITYYAGTIFEQYIGLPPLQSRILAACNGTEYFLASWIAFFTIERFGRRPLMLFGAAGQAITMAILTGTTWAADVTHNNDSHAAVAAAVFLFIFNTFFAIGWLGMTWLYPAEIVPLSIRAPANGLSTAGNWSFNFMVVMITPVAFENISSYTYTIFAVINALMVPVVYFLYPETAGRTLEEMDRIFALSDPKKPWQVVRIAREMPYEIPKDQRDPRAADVEKAQAEHIESTTE